MAKHQFTIGTTKVEIDLTDLNLTEKNVSKSLCEQPGKFAEVASHHARARAQAEGLADDMKLIQARLDAEVRDKLKVAGEKITEDKVSSLVLLDKRYKTAQAALADASLTQNLLLVLVQAYSQRKDCAIELARQYRADLTNSAGSSI